MPSAAAKTNNHELGTRLASWKEIAAYLGKAERTVKRWEKERGLPARRLPGSGNASVYAYSAELDEWLRSGPATEPEAFNGLDPGFQQVAPLTSVLLEAEAPVVPAQIQAETLLPQHEHRRTWLLASCCLLLAGIVGAAVSSPTVRASTERFAHRLPGVMAAHSDSVVHAAAPVSASEKRQAHDLYLKGRYEWAQRTPDSLNRALDDFTQAIVHDPGDAEAYVGMADTYDLLREFSTMPESDAYTRGIAAARKAIEIDDSLSDAHRALGFAEWWGKWDFVDGEKEFRRAIELDPRDPTVRNWYANILLIQARFPEALEENSQAQELDPSSHSILADRGNILVYAGKREQGIALLKDVENASPDLGSPHFYLMRIGLELRDYPSFLEEGRKAAETRNDSVLKDIIGSAEAGYAHDGERGLLNNLYARQRHYYDAGKYSGATLATTCVMMGKKQEALQLLEVGYDHHDIVVLSSVTNPVLATLGNEPEYRSLLKKIDFQPDLRLHMPNSPGSDSLPLRAAFDPH